jgi:hypothetical protein
VVLQHQKAAQNEKNCSEPEDEEILMLQASGEMAKESVKSSRRKPARKLLQKTLKKEQKLSLVSADNVQEPGVAGIATASASIAGDEDEQNGRRAFKN